MSDSESVRGRAVRRFSAVARDVLPAPRAVLIYGSQSAGEGRAHADLDVLFLAPEPADSRRGAKGSVLDRLESALRDFSAHEQLTLDDEVPYHTKLLSNWDEAQDAADARAFTSGGTLLLSPVRRDPDFLGSTRMRERLFLNVFSQPFVGWTEDPGAVRSLQQRARFNLVRAAVSTLTSAGRSVDPDTVVEVLLRGHAAGHPVSYKDWLGYPASVEGRERVRAWVGETLTLSPALLGREVTLGH